MIALRDNKAGLRFYLSGFSLTEDEVWQKLGSYTDGETINNNINDDDLDTMNETARCGEQHCADVLGKRHSAGDEPPLINKRRCAETEERHGADDVLLVETTLLGERHSADRRGITVRGAVASNTSLGAVIRSLSRGIVANLRSMSPPSQHLAGLRRVIASGGALVNNAVMRKAVTDLFKLPLAINATSDTGDSALGAAIAAKRFI